MVFGFEVDDLAADHAVNGAGATGNFFDDANTRVGRATQARKDFVGLGLERVSRQNGDCFAECLVAGGAPAAEVAEARRIIAAFALPENASRGAIQLDGRMVERLHAEMAKRTIAIADAIAAMA